jgi:osmotically inducible protein OsmC
MAATSHVKWSGDLESGEGRFETGSGAVTGTYSAATRFGDEPGTNPEELIAAAHASCFSMALTLVIGGVEGITPGSVETDAKVYIRREGEGFTIHRIDLATVVEADGLGDEDLQKYAQAAKDGCPVSKALAGVEEVNLEARLAG